MVSVHTLVNGIYKSKVTEYSTEKSTHGLAFDSKFNYLYVPHTIPNNIYQYQWRSGSLKSLSPAVAKGPETDKNYHSPRHIVKHPAKDIFYTSNQTGGGISSWGKKANGTLKLAQTFSTLPNNANWKSMVGTIAITADGRFAYVSNRASSPNASIASFALESSGKISKRTGIMKTETMDYIFLLSENGKYLYARGSKDKKAPLSTLTHYLINPTNGTLKKMKKYTIGK